MMHSKKQNWPGGHKLAGILQQLTPGKTGSRECHKSVTMTRGFAAKAEGLKGKII